MINSPVAQSGSNSGPVPTASAWKRRHWIGTLSPTRASGTSSTVFASSVPSRCRSTPAGWTVCRILLRLPPPKCSNQLENRRKTNKHTISKSFTVHTLSSALPSEHKRHKGYKVAPTWITSKPNSGKLNTGGNKSPQIGRQNMTDIAATNKPSLPKATNKRRLFEKAISARLMATFYDTGFRIEPALAPSHIYW